MLVDARGRALPVATPPPKGPRRLEIIAHLREAIRRAGTASEQSADPDIRELLETAVAYCDWPAVHELADALQRVSPHCAHAHACLGTAHLREGSLDEAHLHATMAMLCDPRAADSRQILWEVEHWEQLLRRFPVIPLTFRQRGSLRLELLGPHHLADFLWQYDDPDIPRLCCLPSFRSAEEWLAWLDGEYRLTDQLTFATMHRAWGFVGVVSLVLHRSVGFVYYWVGQDFRGQGLASEGASLLLDLAAAHFGMHTCYAKVFEENIASLRVLEKLGFSRAGIQPLPDDATEIVLRRGPPRTAEMEAVELQRLLDDMGSPVRLPPTLRAAVAGT